MNAVHVGDIVASPMNFVALAACQTVLEIVPHLWLSMMLNFHHPQRLTTLSNVLRLNFAPMVFAVQSGAFAVWDHSFVERDVKVNVPELKKNMNLNVRQQRNVKMVPAVLNGAFVEPPRSFAVETAFPIV